MFFTRQFRGNLLEIISLGSLISRLGHGVTIGIGFSFIAMGMAALNLSSKTANTYAVAPELDDLRSEPRFKEMLKRMNLPE